MSLLSLTFAKITNNEDFFTEWSEPFENIAVKVHGKSVAIVGNARRLSSRCEGSKIDSADIVIRLNRAPIPSEISHGNRTDWIATSIPIDKPLLSLRHPSLVLWMTSRRKRLSWELLRRGGLFINPTKNHHNLWTIIGSRPTTGLMIIDLVRRLPASKIDIFGFDFFESLSLSGSRRAEDVIHDFAAERIWLDRLLASDNRFFFHALTDEIAPNGPLSEFDL